MKRITAIALVSAATFITLGSALARAQTIEAKVPFAFVVRNDVLPAGTYRIRSVGTNLLQIETRDSRVSELSITHFDNSGPAGKNRLVFTKYGDQYFLRQILCESASINSALPASPLEKMAKLREARLRNAEQTVAAVR
jgi:hypothetical protein